MEVVSESLNYFEDIGEEPQGNTEIVFKIEEPLFQPPSTPAKETRTTVPIDSSEGAEETSNSTSSLLSSISCNICDKKFRKQKSLEVHMREHEGKKVGQISHDFYVTICFVYNYQLKRFFSPLFQPYVCEICSKEFNGRLALRNHSFTHSKEPIKCTDCDRTFNYPQLMVDHHKRVHQQPAKMYPCDVCKKEFSRGQTLRVHMLTHTEERPFECDICQEQFKSETYLKAHKLRHSGVKNFSCADCPQSFCTKTELNFHCRNMHSEEKPLECPECNKGFVKQSQLQVHMKVHAKEKASSSFKCPKCAMGFKTIVSLNKHLKGKHTPEKYSCDKCKKEFRLSKSLETHREKGC